MTNFDEFLNEQMKDPEFKAEWDADTARRKALARKYDLK